MANSKEIYNMYLHHRDKETDIVEMALLAASERGVSSEELGERVLNIIQTQCHRYTELNNRTPITSGKTRTHVLMKDVAEKSKKGQVISSVPTLVPIDIKVIRPFNRETGTVGRPGVPMGLIIKKAGGQSKEYFVANPTQICMRTKRVQLVRSGSADRSLPKKMKVRVTKGIDSSRPDIIYLNGEENGDIIITT